MAETDWKLDGCCNNEQITFCCLFAVFIVVNYFLWNTFVLKPIKLLAVFIHEMSHAIACWMTCGTVKGIEVYTNEGGVTKYVGGVRIFVIPAGYLGTAFWGGAFTVLSSQRVASTVIASLMIAALILTLKFSPNKTVVGISFGFIGLNLLVIFLEWFVFSPLLVFVVLYYGVSIGTFAVYDIYDDLITRTVDGSDAKACHEVIPCCFPKCVGVQFVLVAFFFQGLAIYLALVWMGSV